jgi:hypothetical protein
MNLKPLHTRLHFFYILYYYGFAVPIGHVHPLWLTQKPPNNTPLDSIFNTKLILDHNELKPLQIQHCNKKPCFSKRKAVVFCGSVGSANT